ncbi:MAG: ATP-dependent sacrificial sulfur transferase LarE [Deltaproteobacteria bacterium]|nr:ATP-dependent sacrificial sulfur transferase LarE [Deltaproteobacteria bacterium]
MESPNIVTHQKEERLKKRLLGLGSVAVAFSGGVDSTFLMDISHESLGDRALAVTGKSLSFPERELNAACSFTKIKGIRHLVVDSEELGLPGFSDNPPNRCYLCKRGLFGKIKELASREGCQWVIEASNKDDEGDYRPGLIAIAELGIISPLREAGLTKNEIRALSQERGLPTWNKPSFACLASRFPYGERITPEELKKLDRAEELLLNMGFYQVRVRLHEGGKLARIETEEKDFARIMDPLVKKQILEGFSELGFLYTTFDLRGYQTGSMNLTLNMAPKGKTN